MSIRTLQGSLGSGPAAAAASSSATTAVVTALPTSPYDGQEVFYQSAAMASDGENIIWHLRYRGTAGGNGWEFIGGAPWSALVATDQSTSSSTFGDLATVGPTITVPRAGEYLVTISCRMFPSTSGHAAMSYAIGGAAALDADTVEIGLGAAVAGSYVTLGRTKKKSGIAANTAITAKYRTAAAASTSFVERFLSVLPVRLT